MAPAGIGLHAGCRTSRYLAVTASRKPETEVVRVVEVVTGVGSGCRRVLMTSYDAASAGELSTGQSGP